MTTAQYTDDSVVVEQATYFELSLILPFGFDPDAEVHLLQSLGSVDAPTRWQLVAADCGEDAAISFLLADLSGDVIVVDALGATEPSAIGSALAECSGRVTWIPPQGQDITASILMDALHALTTSGAGVLVDERLGLIGHTKLLASVAIQMPQAHPSRLSLMHALAADVAMTGSAVEIAPAPCDQGLTPILLSLIDDGRASTLAMRLLATSTSIDYNPSTRGGPDYLAYLTDLAGQIALPSGGAPPTGATLDRSELSRRALRGMWQEFSDYRREIAPQARYWAEPMGPATLPAVLSAPLIIVLVSDPRDVWCSLNSASDLSGLTAMAGLTGRKRRAELERFHQSVTELVGRRYPDASRVLLVRYEDLLSDLSRQARRIGTWLGVTLDAEAILAADPTLGAAAAGKNSATAAGRWQRELSTEEVLLFNERMAREMIKLGYAAATEAELADLAARDQSTGPAGLAPAARGAAPATGCGRPGCGQPSMMPGAGESFGSAERKPAPADLVVGPDTLAEMAKVRWWHRIRLGVGENGLPVYTPGKVFHGADGEDFATHRFGLPTDMTGLRVADIGGWDGFFSFEAERRGAGDVTIFDVDQSKGGNWGGTLGFQFAKKALRSNVGYVSAGIYDITPENDGQFDVAFFFGVLYHLKEPLTALYRLFDMVAPGGYALIETARAQRSWVDENACAFMYAPGLEGDPTNYFYPTPVALNKALSEAGFSTVKAIYDDGARYTVYAGK